MAQRASHWKLGLFVVAAFAIAFGALLWLGTAQLRRQFVYMVTYFDESVDGLSIGAPVQFRGVPIGSVSRLRIAPDRRHVEVQGALYLDVLRAVGLAWEERRKTLPETLRVRLSSSGITGVKFVDADFYDPRYVPPPPELPFATPENYVPAAPSMLKSLSDSIVEAATKAPRLVEAATELAHRAYDTLEDVDLHGVAERLKKALDRVDEKVAEVDASSISGRTEIALDDVHEALATLRSTAKSIGALAEDLRSEIPAVRAAVTALEDAAQTLQRDPSSVLYGKTPERPPEMKGGNGR
jgi:ABC-type transporter Mla subunit MlaD